jgi:hypothetical protein
MNEDNRERPLGLSPAQVTGSAMAAMSGAVVASWAGTTGTIIGAAVASVIATIGAATYTWSLRRTSDAVRRTAAQVRQTALLTNSLPRTVAEGPLRAGARPEPDTRSQTTDDDRRRWDLPWGKVLIASAVVTVIALGGITAIEALTGRPVSSYAGKDDSSGTTLGHVVGSDDATRSADDERTKDPVEETDRSPGEGNAGPDAPAPSTTPHPTPSPAQPTDPPTSAPTEEPSLPPAETESPPPADTTTP